MISSLQKMAFAAVFAIGMALPSAGLADEKHPHGPMGGDMKAKGMMHDGCAKGMMHHGCAKGMGGDMIALADGGFVVKCGPQLMKYDKDLKPVAKATIECEGCAKDAHCSKEMPKEKSKEMGKPTKPAETPKK